MFSKRVWTTHVRPRECHGRSLSRWHQMARLSSSDGRALDRMGRLLSSCCRFLDERRHATGTQNKDPSKHETHEHNTHRTFFCHHIVQFSSSPHLRGTRVLYLHTELGRGRQAWKKKKLMSILFSFSQTSMRYLSLQTGTQRKNCQTRKSR